MVGAVDALAGDEPRPVRLLDLDDTGHLAALETASTLALDVETDNFHAYRERVCLLQLATPEADWFFDPLADDGVDPRLARELARNDRPVVVHAGDNDVRALARDFKLRLGQIFDTALAARVLGLPHLGLKALLETQLDVQIDKGEQRSDWSQRPLTVEQLRYARQDVRWLTQLSERLGVLLDEQERRPWHEEECERTRQAEPSVKSFDPESWRKAKGAKGLGPRGRAVMARLWSWREGLAAARNIPAVRVAYPEQLVRVARVADAHGSRALDKVAGFGFLPSSMDRDDLRAVIEQGLAGEDPGARRPPRQNDAPKPPMDEPTKARLVRLKEGRDRWSKLLGIEPGFLLTNQLLERIARAAPRAREALPGVEGLGGWRSEVLGQEILDALRL